jgi:hypothetical protein
MHGSVQGDCPRRLPVSVSGWLGAQLIRLILTGCIRFHRFEAFIRNQNMVNGKPATQVRTCAHRLTPAISI